MYFFILLVIYLMAEGSALVFVAGQAGWLAALALIFLVSMVGAYLVRRQGAMALVRIQEALARRESPDAELLDGVFIFMAGVLLFIPGFLSDLVGLVLLIPPLRKAFGPWLLTYLKSRVESGRYIRTYTVYDYEWREPRRNDDSSQNRLRIIDLPAHEVDQPQADDKDDNNSHRPGQDGRSGA